MILSELKTVEQMALAVFRPGEQLSVEPVVSGHIHRTLVVRSLSGDPVGVMQRINDAIFPDPIQVIENGLKISDHLGAQGDDLALRYRRTADGDAFFRDESGGCWRFCDYVTGENLAVFDTIERVSQFALAFGEFIARIQGCDVASTLPGYYDIAQRWNDLVAARDEADAERLDAARDVLHWLEREAAGFIADFNCDQQLGLPMRLCHGDIKLSNIIFTSSGPCVIDYDTVMPGYWMYDFSDGLRGLFSPVAGVDDIDRAMKVYFDSFCEGLGVQLTSAEREAFWIARSSIPFSLCVRFLTDYLRGDVYFRVTQPEHNLSRAIAQQQVLTQLRGI